MEVNDYVLIDPTSGNQFTGATMTSYGLSVPELTGTQVQVGTPMKTLKQWQILLTNSQIQKYSFYLQGKCQKRPEDLQEKKTSIAFEVHVICGPVVL